jgi:hypothetical protein
LLALERKAEGERNVRVEKIPALAGRVGCHPPTVITTSQTVLGSVSVGEFGVVQGGLLPHLAALMGRGLGKGTIIKSDDPKMGFTFFFLN